METIYTVKSFILKSQMINDFNENCQRSWKYKKCIKYFKLLKIFEKQLSRITIANFESILPNINTRQCRRQSTPQCTPII